MRISRKSEYALRALVALARTPRSCPVPELSAKENIPVKFLEQILLVLRQGGLLASKRGVGGGYTLRVAPSRISVGQVIALVDGPIAPVPCALDPTGQACSCPEPRTCPVRLAMTALREQIEETLGRQSIEDLARPEAGAASYEI